MDLFTAIPIPEIFSSFQRREERFSFRFVFCFVARLERRRNWFWRLFSFQWRTPFQLVLLDHGRYLEMDHETRLGYCELWCSLVRGDQRRAIEAATQICHGDSGGRLLPNVLYRPFDRQTRQSIKMELNLSELIQVLHTAPQSLVDALRIMAVVRHVAAALADVKSDR